MGEFVGGRPRGWQGDRFVGFYPGFLRDPPPVLRRAITADLVKGKVRESDYRNNQSPPILHRKEAFLPPDHPNRRLFNDLTEAEEAAGLYADSSTIGFKLNWDRLVASKGLRHDGHRLITTAAIDSQPEPTPPAPWVERQELAVHKRNLSVDDLWCPFQLGRQVAFSKQPFGPPFAQGNLGGSFPIHAEDKAVAEVRPKLHCHHVGVGAVRGKNQRNASGASPKCPFV